MKPTVSKIVIGSVHIQAVRGKLKCSTSTRGKLTTHGALQTYTAGSLCNIYLARLFDDGCIKNTALHGLSSLKSRSGLFLGRHCKRQAL